MATRQSPSEPRVLIVIPARYASSRFPGKPLAPIDGIPMVVRAVRIAEGSVRAARVVVATDDERIAAVVREGGGEVVMTSPTAPSGTDRVWEAAAASTADPAPASTADPTADPAADPNREDIVVNLQGDEPLLPPAVLDELIGRLLADPSLDMATPAVPTSRTAAHSPDVVTVACDDDGSARYFSRSVIPWGIDPVRRHIGVYAYRRDALRRFVGAGPSDLERAESLEQLRALGLGLKIGVVDVDAVLHAVDRPADVAAVERLLAIGGVTPPGPPGGEPAGGPPIRLVVLDADGVLTDGRISYLADGAQLVSFDVKDGQGIVALRAAGVEVAILSARDSPALRHRAAELGITNLRLSVADKAAELVGLTGGLGISLGEVCYVGDDVADLAPMLLCGLSAAPADAAEPVLRAAAVVLARPGGRGAVRELADMLLGPTFLGPTRLGLNR